MSNSKTQYGDFTTYLAATAPALFQLIAVVSIGLSDKLRIGELFIFPNIINLANFIIILLVISIISLYSYWDSHGWKINMNISKEENKVDKKSNVFPTEKSLWRVLGISIVVMFLSFLSLIIIIITKEKIQLMEVWGMLQWVCYIFGMTSASFMIYSLFLLKSKESKNAELVENFLPKLKDSLRQNGHIKNPDVMIRSIDKNAYPHRIWVVIEEENYLVEADYSGEMTQIRKLRQNEVDPI